MANVKITTIEEPYSGMHVDFRAPCNCSSVEGLIINDVTYSLVNAAGVDISGCGAWVENSIVSVILDCESNKAYVQNPAPSYPDSMNAWPVGSLYITDTDESPASKLGGSWQLVDMDYDYQVFFADQDKPSSLFTPSDNVGDWSVRVVIVGKTLTVRFILKSTVTIDESTLDFGMLSLSSANIAFATETKYGFGWSDGGDGIVLFRITSTGQLQSFDVVGEKPMAAGQNIHLEYVYLVENFIAGNNCPGKYYWKRTA